MRLLPTAVRSRLAALFAAGVVVVVALAVALLALGVDHQFDDALDSGLSSRASALTSALAHGDTDVVSGDPLAAVLRSDGTVELHSSSLDQALAPGRDSDLLRAPELRAAATATASDPVRVDRRIPSLQRTEFLQGLVRVQAEPVVYAGRPAVLVVGAHLDPVYDAEGRLLLLFVAGAAPLALLLGVAGWLLAGAALRPVRALTAQAARISAADTDQRLPQPVADDEIAELTRTLNGMLARVDAGVRREREFVDDAAHELRTPIAVLRGELELALRTGVRAGDLSADVEESLRSALTEAERLSRLAQDLLALATTERRGASGEPVDALGVARAEVERLEAILAVRVEVTGSSALVTADPHDLGRLLTNLLVNAESAGARRALVVVGPASGPASADGPTGVVLRVDDDGPGFPPELLATATERFTRGDRARTRGTSGAGLGLAIVAAVARAHGGGVVLANGGRLGGASTTVTLPA